MDFPGAPTPIVVVEPLGVHSSYGPEAPCGSGFIATGQSGSTAGTWGAANTAHFYPIIVQRQVTVYQMAVEVTTQSGNCDIGIYDENFVRLVSMGSTAVAAAGVQVFNIADTTIGPGIYYFAFVASSTTPAFRRSAVSAPVLRTLGAFAQASALPLPSTATPAAISSAGPYLISASLYSATM